MVFPVGSFLLLVLVFPHVKGRQSARFWENLDTLDRRTRSERNQECVQQSLKRLQTAESSMTVAERRHRVIQELQAKGLKVIASIPWGRERSVSRPPPCNSPLLRGHSLWHPAP